MNYQNKYIKYNNKYLELSNHLLNYDHNQIGGSEIQNIIILHHPIIKTTKISQDIKLIIKKLSKFGKIHNYWFNFSKDHFELNDLLFENVAKDIDITFSNLNSFFLIALEHACPFGLYYTYHYHSKCTGIICYPFRYYSKGSYKRRIWKLKENNGYAKVIKNYNIDEYMININNKRLQTLINDNSNNGKYALWYVIDFYLQKQYYKIPTKFKIPTILYTRLDLDIKSIIKNNYNRTDIASMKKIFSENDALQQSMIWNYERIKYDDMLKNKNKSTPNNKNKKLLKIKYIISGWENYQDIIDEVILLND